MDHGSIMICKAFHHALAILWNMVPSMQAQLYAMPKMYCTMDQGFLTVRLAVHHAPGILRNIVPLMYAYIY